MKLYTSYRGAMQGLSALDALVDGFRPGYVGRYPVVVDSLTGEMAYEEFARVLKAISVLEVTGMGLTSEGFAVGLPDADSARRAALLI